MADQNASQWQQVTSGLEKAASSGSSELVVNAVPMQKVLERARSKINVTKKTIYIVRHAEAVHNAMENQLKTDAKAAGKDEREQKEAMKAALPEERFRDARLSSKGEDQVQKSQASLEQLFEEAHYPRPAIVFASPLRRTLMTTSILFDGHSDVRAIEIVRERRTGFPCDERQPAAASSAEFPNVNFSNIVHLDNESDDCHNFRRELKETYKDVAERGKQLLPLIESLHTDVVAVVSHKGYIRELLQDTWSDVLQNPEGLSFELSNAEVRVIEAHWCEPGTMPSICMRSLSSVKAEPPMKLYHAEPHRRNRLLTNSAIVPSLDKENTGCYRRNCGTLTKEDAHTPTEKAWLSLKENLGGLRFCFPENISA